MTSGQHPYQSFSRRFQCIDIETVNDCVIGNDVGLTTSFFVLSEQLNSCIIVTRRTKTFSCVESNHIRLTTSVHHFFKSPAALESLLSTRISWMRVMKVITLGLQPTLKNFSKTDKQQLSLTLSSSASGDFSFVEAHISLRRRKQKGVVFSHTPILPPKLSFG